MLDVTQLVEEEISIVRRHSAKLDCVNRALDSLPCVWEQFCLRAEGLILILIPLQVFQLTVIQLYNFWSCSIFQRNMKSTSSWSWPVRWETAILIYTGLICNYAMRMNISIAILKVISKKKNFCQNRGLETTKNNINIQGVPVTFCDTLYSINI